jgi:hypothetical protein
MGSMCLGFIGDKALPKYSTKQHVQFLEALRALVLEDKFQGLDINSQLNDLEIFTDDNGTTSVFMTYNEHPASEPKGIRWPESIYRMIDNIAAATRVKLHYDITEVDDCDNKRRSVRLEAWPNQID